MVAARRQRKAQKLQEQQISKALIEAKPAANHLSFDDDDDEIASATQGEPPASSSTGPTQPTEGLEDDSQDDDAPIEVVSNKTSRKQASQNSAKLKALEKA